MTRSDGARRDGARLDVVRHGGIVLRSLLRRRLSVVILVVLPLAFYLATHDAVGRSTRALVFGITWAVSTVAFFAAVSAREVEPRLRLAGRSRSFLVSGRIGALLAVSLVLSVAFWLLVAVDQPVRSVPAVAVNFVVSAAVAVAFGTAVGALIAKEMEGTLVLFFFAGLQAITNPFDAHSKALPFWSSRELGTWAVDGPAQGSLMAGIAHGAAVIALCAIVLVVTDRRRTHA